MPTEQLAHLLKDVAFDRKRRDLEDYRENIVLLM